MTNITAKLDKALGKLDKESQKARGQLEHDLQEVRAQAESARTAQAEASTKIAEL